MLSAESFISNIDARALSMEETEFETNMESARALLSGLSGDLPDQPTLPDQHSGQLLTPEPTKHQNKVISYNKDSVQTTSSEAKSESGKRTFTDDLSISKVPSLSELENKGATMLLKEHQVNEVFREYPYLFAHVGDLTVSDVEDLLNNYKQLVFKYVCLSKGLGVAPASCSTPNSQNNVQDHAETTIQSSDSGAVVSNEKAEVSDSETMDDREEKSTHGTEDSSDGVSFDEKKIESNVPQDGTAAPQSEGNLETSD